MKAILTVLFMALFIISITISAHAQEELWKELNKRRHNLYYARQYLEAEILASEALSVAEKTFGPDHLNTATSISDLSALFTAPYQVGCEVK